MVEPGSAGAGGGTPGAPAGTPPGGGGTPPANAGGGGSGGAGPKLIDESVLPPELRGRTLQEQKFILDNMASGLRSANSQVKDLQAQIEALKKGGRAEPPTGGKPGKPAASDDKPLEELILEDAEAAITRTVEKVLGGRLQHLEQSVSKNVLRAMRQEFDDWDEHEEDVLALVEASKADATEGNMRLAYDAVTGRKAREAKRLATASAHNSELPQGDVAGKPVLKEPEGLEGEIFRASRMTLAEWHHHKDPANFAVKVPTGKKA